MIKSGPALQIISSDKYNTAAKLQLIMELLDTNIYDDEGNVIGTKDALITKEEALSLLNLSENEEK